MDYLYIIFPFAVWTISQTIKFFIRVFQKKTPTQLKSLLWVYIWAGGAPSTHTAILTSSLVIIWYNFGFSSIFTFCLGVTMLLLFDLVSSRKRQEVMNNYFMQDGDLKKSVSDGYLLDLAGHTLGEIAWGAVLGIVLGFVAINIIN